MSSKEQITCERDVINFDTPNRDKSLGNGCNFKSSDVLGRGSYGTVIRAIYKSESVAVKILDIEKYHNYCSFLNESNILNIVHENIIKIIKVIKTPRHGLIIMQRFRGESLQYIIDRHVLVLQHRLWIVRDVLSALQHCHEHGIYHLDVKPQNILVDFLEFKSPNHNYICKLCDFGCSAKIDELLLNKPKQCRGTIRYMAPEILKSYYITASADIYSLGITMWQLKTSQYPYKHIHSNDVVIYGVVKNDIRPDSMLPIEQEFARPFRSKENLMNSVNCKSFNQKSVKLGILKLQNCSNFKKIIPKINIIRSEYEFRKSSALDVFALSPRNNIRQQVSQKSPKGTFVRELNFETSSAQELSSLCHSENIELTNQVNPVGDEESEFLLEIFNSKCSLKKHSLGEQQYASLYQECWHSEPHVRPTIKYLVNTINQMILSGFQDL